MTETIAYRSLGTVNSFIEGYSWPVDFVLPENLQEFLENIYVIDYAMISVPGGQKATVWLAFEGEQSLALPGLEGVKLVVFGGAVEGLTFITATVEVGDRKAFSLENLRFSLRFDDNILKPAALNEGDLIAQFAEISITGSISINSDLDISVKGFNALELSPAMIGDSGVIIAAKEVKLDLSRTRAIPEVLAAGFDESFMGVFIGEAQVKLPDGLPALAPEDLILTNAAIGSGGVSGRLTASYSPVFNEETKTFTGPGGSTLFGIPFGLENVAIELKQNALIEAGLRGQMLLPFFDEPVSVGIGINLDGSFSISLNDTDADGLYTLTKESLLQLRLDSIGFEVAHGVLTARLSGELTPLFGGLDWPGFQVKELAIDSEGNVHLDGGWLDLRDQYSLDFHGFKIEVTKLGFGKTEDGTGKWIGFSGGLKLVDDFSAGASVEGLRITWYPDGDTKITLNGVGVEFEVPDVLRFKGEVSYRELPGDIHRFDGDIKLDLISLDMQIDAQLVIGTSGTGPDRHNFFAIYLGLELPAGIPLGGTGLALYGMAGLFALEMEPNKLPAEGWFENADGSPGWYMRPAEGVSDLSTKWVPVRKSLALGAGVTLGTVADNGYAFSGKFLFVIVFPGPILLVEGRANILKERAKLDEQPIFRALAVLDRREGTFRINLAADYKYGDEAQLIKIGGDVEAFFDFSDAGAWHLYLGEKEPPEKRMRAEVFQLFEANSYLMLDARQLAFGAWVGFDKRWKFGPLSVTVAAWIEGNVVLSRKPIYLQGGLWLHGEAALKVFGRGLTLTVDANFAAKVFDPYHITASFTVGIGLPWPLPDFKHTIELEWKQEGADVPPLPLPLKEIAVEHFKTTTSWPLTRPNWLMPVYDTDSDGFVNEGSVSQAKVDEIEKAEPPADAPVVPLDCRPHITFGRSVHDRPLIGTNADFVDPPLERIGDPEKNEGPVEVEYALREIELHKYENAAWSRIARLSDSEPAVGELFGSWAPIAGNSTDGVVQVKLWLWSKSAFDYTRHTGSAWNEWFTSQYETYPCVTPPRDRVICCDFERIAATEVLLSPYSCGEHENLYVYWNTPREVSVTALDPPIMGFKHALCFPRAPIGVPPNLSLHFPVAAKSVQILIAPHAQSQITAMGFKGDTHVAGPVTPAGNILELNADGMTRVVVGGDVCILQICINIGPDPSQVQLHQEMSQHLNEEMARWSQKGYVLEPYSTYRIKVVTQASVTGIEPANLFTEFAYFRTEGPPGLVTLSVPVGQDAVKFDSGLNDLTRYVAQTIPPTVPAEGEKPLLPRPVYRAYDVGVDFNENYVDLMYRIAGRDLNLYLFDNNNQPVRDVNGRLIIINNRWGVTEDLKLTESENYWITTVNGSDCARIDQTTIPHNKTLVAANEQQVLDGDTVYEARLVPLLLHETFNDYEVGATAGELGRWTVIDEGIYNAPSHWQINEQGVPASRYVIQTSEIWGGSTAANDPVKPGTLLVYGNTPSLPSSHPEQSVNWTDYRLSVFVRAKDDDAIGLVFRFQDATHHYRFSMDRERKTRRLLKIYNQTTTILAEDEFSYTLNRDYLVTIEAIGSRLRVYMDGDPVFDTIDEAFSSGTIGLYSWGNNGARFSDVRVDDFSNAAPTVYRFKFTTSQFTNFFHHLHSYNDDTWRTIVTDGTAVATALGAAVGSGPISDSEGRAYEELAKLAGITTLPNPKEVQVTRLEFDDGNSSAPFALLVQCLEPIDWNRTDLELTRADRAASPVIPPQEAKLTDVTFGASRPIDESVTVLTRSALNLTDFRIEQRTFPGGIAETGHGEVLFRDEFETADGLLFLEDFGPNALDHYTIVDEGTELTPSNWKVEGLAIVQSSNIYGGDTSRDVPDKPGTIALLKGSEWWVNARISVVLNSGDDEAIGFIFRYQDANNYYRYSFDRRRAYRRLIKKVDGVVTVLWEDDGAYNTGQSLTIVLECFNGHFVAHWDTQLLFNVHDDDLNAGRMGFYCWSNAPSRFEALEVNSLHSDPVLFESVFTDVTEVQVVDEPGEIEGPSLWTAEGGVLQQLSTVHAPENGAHFPGTYAIAGDPHWRDVQIAARIRSDDDEGIGIMFRYTDSDNYYLFSMDRQRSFRRCIKKVDGVVTVLWEDAVAYNTGQHYLLTIRAVGSELSVYQNGSQLFEVHDDDLRAGRVAFYCWNNAGAHFERILVTDATRQLGKWIVTDEAITSAPSRWKVKAGALLQQTSIGDAATPAQPGSQVIAADGAWTDYRLTASMRSDASGAIGIIFRYVDESNYYRLSFDQLQGRRRLIKKEAGVVTPLWENSGSFTIGTDFIVTVDAVGPRLIGYFDSERLFDLTDPAHPAGQIGLYSWANNGARFGRVEVRQPTLDAYVLFRDRFAAGDTTEWTIVDEGTVLAPSAWSIFEGTLRQSKHINEPPFAPLPLSKRGTHAVAGDPAWTDVIVTARLQSFQKEDFGLMLRYADANNYYRFSMNSVFRYRRLVKNVAGNFILLWQDDYKYELGRSYDFTFVLTGNTLYGYMDGAPMFVVEDSDVTTGQIGLYSWFNSDARFSNILVFPVSKFFNDWQFNETFDALNANTWTFVDEGTVDAPSAWQVTEGSLKQTSNINDGNLFAPEKLGTFAVTRDAIWDDMRLVVRLANFNRRAIGVMFRYADSNNYYRLTLDREDFSRLIKKVNGVVTVLWQASRLHAEGREYIVKIDCAGSQLTGYSNGELLFEVDDPDLSSGRIGLYCYGNSDARFTQVQVVLPAWATYYAFSSEETFPAGTRVQVFSGNEAELVGSKDAPGLVRRFVATLNDKGFRCLNASGSDLRLVAPDGEKIHARRFLPDTDYLPIGNTPVLRKADGTAFIVTRTSDIQPLLSTGEYRLKLTYRRDNRSVDPESQVFSQTGDTDSEVAILDIPWAYYFQKES